MSPFIQPLFKIGPLTVSNFFCKMFCVSIMDGYFYERKRGTDWYFKTENCTGRNKEVIVKTR